MDATLRADAPHVASDGDEPRPRERLLDRISTSMECIGVQMAHRSLIDAALTYSESGLHDDARRILITTLEIVLRQYTQLASGKCALRSPDLKAIAIEARKRGVIDRSRFDRIIGLSAYNSRREPTEKHMVSLAQEVWFVCAKLYEAAHRPIAGRNGRRGRQQLQQRTQLVS